LKIIIFCNGLDPETHRSEAKSKCREREWGYCGGGRESPHHQLRGLWEQCKVHQGVRGGAPENLDFGAFGPQKSRQNGLSDNVLFCFFFFLNVVFVFGGFGGGPGARAPWAPLKSGPGSSQGFRGRRIEWRSFRFDKIQHGD